MKHLLFLLIILAPSFAFADSVQCLDNADCSDGLVCNGEEVCDNERCMNGDRILCGDMLMCVDDDSDNGFSCIRFVRGETCIDDSDCNFGDECKDNACVHEEPPKDCDKGNGSQCVDGGIVDAGGALDGGLTDAGQLEGWVIRGDGGLDQTTLGALEQDIVDLLVAEGCSSSDTKGSLFSLALLLLLPLVSNKKRRIK